MVKGFDQDGHKDRHYDEGNGKPWRKYYVKDQPSGQNQGDANREQQDGGGYPHMTFSRDKKWVNSRQTSEVHGAYNIPRTAGIARGSRTRFACPNQIKSINKALTSVSEKMPICQNSSPEYLTDGGSSGSTAKEKNICTDKSYCPLIASDSENIPMQNLSPEYLTDGGSIGSTAMEMQKNLSPVYLTGGDSSSSIARGKSFTPTLTDL